MFDRLQKPEKRVKVPKRMKTVGKRTVQYNKWRDQVAIPYLTATLGFKCTWCGTPDNLQIDHILTRGSHPELKMELTNVRYLCTSCHGTRQ